MDSKAATQQFNSWLCEKYPDCGLLETATREYASCFVFYYQSQAYIKTGDVSQMLIGQGPVLLDKLSGEIFETGSAYTESQCVKAFEACGDPLAEPSARIIITGCASQPNVVMAVKLIRQSTSLDLARVKRLLDQVLDGGQQHLDIENMNKIPNIIQQLEAYGFKCQSLWHCKK